jgi:hypothetical protein
MSFAVQTFNCVGPITVYATRSFSICAWPEPVSSAVNNGKTEKTKKNRGNRLRIDSPEDLKSHSHMLVVR